MTVLRVLQADEAAPGISDDLAAAVAEACSSVSHNLHGQKLGRKGRVTRERILAATIELLESPEQEPITLSAVARRASLGMTSLYNYFGDLTELLLAVLEPVMATAEDAFVAMLRQPWPDEELHDRCYRFLRDYYAFWYRHARLLHLRNAMADGRDERMLRHRVHSTMPIISLLAAQMNAENNDTGAPAYAMATVLMTGVERTVTVATDSRYAVFSSSGRYPADYYLKPEARLMELAIRDTRRTTACDTARAAQAAV